MANPWYKEYGIIGTLGAIVVLSNVSVHVSVSSFKSSVNTRLAIIENEVSEIPPPEQIAHNKQVNQELGELKAERIEDRKRLDAIVERFHEIIPRLINLLETLPKRSNIIPPGLP